MDCRSTTPPPPYSIFTITQKRIIVCLISFAATFSPLSSFIYFPAIGALSRSLDVSIGRINLTVTSYLIVAGLAPCVLGDLADNTGRRAVYILMMTIYCIANIGLALQSNWAALLILRMVQSAGSAATIALGYSLYGVVSDIVAPSERGGYVSGLVLGPNIATAIGPIVGGALTSYPGWRWIFWLLSILSGTCLFLLVMLLPETARLVVGNGSVQVSGIHPTVLSHFQTPRLPPSSEIAVVTEAGFTMSQEDNTKKHFRVPNPLRSWKLLWARDTALITLIFGVFYMNLSSLQASLSTLFINLYGITEIQAGLIYLPSGIGSCAGAYGAGAVLDHDYRTTARKHDMIPDARAENDISGFPIEKARFRSIWYFIGAAAVSVIGYGWALDFKVHIAIPLSLQFIIGLSTAVIFNMCGTLLVDVHPHSSSAAQAANSLVRAFLAGGGTAIVQTLLDSIGVGWTFTLFGTICLGCVGFAWFEWKYGKIWRDDIERNGGKR
ncbi:MFS general substrate transporter [Xylaria telfairii]|nr:MFS general substrate transporter [Xylaria telfairii]